MRSAFVKILLALFGFAVPFGDFVPACAQERPINETKDDSRTSSDSKADSGDRNKT